ncbi:MAG: hypothetical protein GY724_17630, partial [Actinomycetia bacterium]|nr:hypothetical protein [Actinomycetes bacterium]
HPPLRRGARSAHHAPAGVYECAGHDRWLTLTVYDEADWALLVTVIPALDRAQWAGVEARRLHHDEIDRLITTWTSARSPNEAMAELQRAGLAAATAFTNQDLVEDPQLATRSFMVAVDQPACGPRLYPGSPFLVDGKPIEIQPVSSLGGNNDEILAELGLSPDQRAELVASATIATSPPA